MDLVALADWIDEVEHDRAFPHEDLGIPELPVHFTVDPEFSVEPSILPSQKKNPSRSAYRRRNPKRTTRLRVVSTLHLRPAAGPTPESATPPPVIMPPKRMLAVIAATIPPTVLVPPMPLTPSATGKLEIEQLYTMTQVAERLLKQAELQDLAEKIEKHFRKRYGSKDKSQPVEWEKLQLAF